MHTYLLDLFLTHSEVATDWIIALSCLGFFISALVIGATVCKYLKPLYDANKKTAYKPFKPFGTRPVRRMYPWRKRHWDE